MAVRGTVRGAAAFLLLLLLRSSASSSSSGTKSDDDVESDSDVDSFVLVQMWSPSIPVPTKVAVQACAGLFNRDRSNATAPEVYVILSKYPNDDDDDDGRNKNNMSFGQSPDQSWIDALGWTPSSSYEAEAFLSLCLRTFPRRVRYDYESQRAVLPNIFTIGAVLDAVPLDVHHSDDVDGSEVVFDAVKSFSHNSPLEATRYVYERYVDRTTAMVKVNPGFEERLFPYPSIAGHISPHLIDFIFKERLFAFFLPHGCVPLTSERALVQRMAADSTNPWPRPIPVYGYDTSLVVKGGDVFEAETLCVPARNMGAINSIEATNLSFFSSSRRSLGRRRGRRGRGRSEGGKSERQRGLRGGAGDNSNDVNDDGKRKSGIVQNPPMNQPYNASRVYVAFIVGDGDNIAFLKGTRADWMQIRLDACNDAKQDGRDDDANPDYSKRCAPITWTLSPHLLHLAPSILSWYERLSHLTGRDYFLLPPSGHLYSYPASTPPSIQSRIVSATERDAQRLNTSGVVDWEWFTAWREAEVEYYPRYCENGRVRGIFPLSVPYFSPTFRFGEGEYYKVIRPPPSSSGDKGEGEGEGVPVVMFRPREWRDKSPADMADELASYPPGTVAYAYMTSDGGLTLAKFQEMSMLVPEYVELVGTEDATRLALEAEASKKSMSKEREGKERSRSGSMGDDGYQRVE